MHVSVVVVSQRRCDVLQPIDQQLFPFPTPVQVRSSMQVKTAHLAGSLDFNTSATAPLSKAVRTRNTDRIDSVDTPKLQKQPQTARVSGAMARRNRCLLANQGWQPSRHVIPAVEAEKRLSPPNKLQGSRWERMLGK